MKLLRSFRMLLLTGALYILCSCGGGSQGTGMSLGGVEGRKTIGALDQTERRAICEDIRHRSFVALNGPHNCRPPSAEWPEEYLGEPPATDKEGFIDRCERAYDVCVSELPKTEKEFCDTHEGYKFDDVTTCLDSLELLKQTCDVPLTVAAECIIGEHELVASDLSLWTCEAGYKYKQDHIDPIPPYADVFGPCVEFFDKCPGLKVFNTYGGSCSLDLLVEFQDQQPKPE